MKHQLAGLFNLTQSARNYGLKHRATAVMEQVDLVDDYQGYLCHVTGIWCCVHELQRQIGTNKAQWVDYQLGVCAVARFARDDIPFLGRGNDQLGLGDLLLRQLKTSENGKCEMNRLERSWTYSERTQSFSRKTMDKNIIFYLIVTTEFPNRDSEGFQALAKIKNHFLYQRFHRSDVPTRQESIATSKTTH